MMADRVLISTIAPGGGGVVQMTRFVADSLREGGLTPILGFYEPYSLSPQLSVPSFRLLQRRVGSHRAVVLDRLEGHGIGAWLPELEFTHYWPTRLWRELLDSCRYHLSVSGNCLAGLPYALTGRPFLAWIATSWHGDRKDRVVAFPWYRRLLDSGLNSRVIRRLERRVLCSGTVLALSRYTRDELDRLVPMHRAHGILPMPVDTRGFTPDEAMVVPGRLGFVGRIGDPRKHTALLVRALARLRRWDERVTAELIGGDPEPVVMELMAELDVMDAIRVTAHTPREALPQRLRAMDVFVLPSHQEGLCIAALEAMACGCPVVSTRCGGPEEFVVDDETGYLVDSDPRAMADAVQRIVGDRGLRRRLSRNARQLVEERYNSDRAKAIFWDAFRHAFEGSAKGAED